MSSSERKPVSQITDRAKRYRAVRVLNSLKREKRCFRCGSKRFLVPDHKDGDESNNAPSNLRWACKSCNTLLGKRMAKAGRGVRTRQYNPGATNLAQYVQAAMDHVRGSHDAAGKVLHETPKAVRREFAREIWFRRGYRGNPPQDIMPEFWAGKLKDSHGRMVKTKEQAKAILLSELRAIGKIPPRQNPRKRAEGELEVLDKLPHGDVDYEPHSKHSPEKCSNCAHFIASSPPRCQTVKSPISPGAWCERYDPSGRNPKEYTIWKDATGRYYWEIPEEVRTARAILNADAHGTAGNHALAMSAIRQALRKNPHMRVFLDHGKYTAAMYDEKFGNLYASGSTKKQAANNLHAEWLRVRKRGSWRNPGVVDTIRARRNPGEADDLYRKFHGRGPDKIYEMQVAGIDPYGGHPELTSLGPLIRFIVGEGVILGGQYGDEVREAEWVREISFVPSVNRWHEWLERTDPPLAEVKAKLREYKAPDLAAVPNTRQLYIVGGNQNLDSMLRDLGADPEKDLLDLGNCYLIEYFTQKRFDHFDPINYFHALGEKTHVQPRLLYDRVHHLLSLAGGEYVVTARGIEN